MLQLYHICVKYVFWGAGWVRACLDLRFFLVRSQFWARSWFWGSLPARSRFWGSLPARSRLAPGFGARSRLAPGFLARSRLAPGFLASLPPRSRLTPARGGPIFSPTVFVVRFAFLGRKFKQIRIVGRSVVENMNTDGTSTRQSFLSYTSIHFA